MHCVYLGSFPVADFESKTNSDILRMRCRIHSCFSLVESAISMYSLSGVSSIKLCLRTGRGHIDSQWSGKAGRQYMQ